MNRRAMFAKVAGVALGVVAAKVGLNLTPPAPSHGFGMIGGVNMLDGGSGRFDLAVWRMQFDRWWAAEVHRRGQR